MKLKDLTQQLLLNDLSQQMESYALDQTMTFVESTSDFDAPKRFNESFDVYKNVKRSRKNPISPRKNSKFEKILGRKKISELLGSVKIGEILGKNKKMSEMSPKHHNFDDLAKLKQLLEQKNKLVLSEISGGLQKRGSGMGRNEMKSKIMKDERRSLRNQKLTGRKDIGKYKFGSNEASDLEGKLQRFVEFEGKDFKEVDLEVGFEASPNGVKSGAKKMEFANNLENIEISENMNGKTSTHGKSKMRVISRSVSIYYYYYLVSENNSQQNGVLSYNLPKSHKIINISQLIVTWPKSGLSPAPQLNPRQNAVSKREQIISSPDRGSNSKDFTS